MLNINLNFGAYEENYCPKNRKLWSINPRFNETPVRLNKN